MTLYNKTNVKAILFIELNHILLFIITFLLKEQVPGFNILFILAFYFTSLVN